MRDERIDAYIAKARPFAQPILEHLRELVHTAEPDAEEGLRWKAPFFILEGRQLCGMASFKQHCAFIVEWDDSKEAMGSFGRITSLDDLPSDTDLVALIRAKAARIRSGEDQKARRKDNAKLKPKIPVPDDFAEALANTPNAAEVFAGFTDAQRRDYLEWVTGAKREATRAKRIATAAEWIGEGKRRNWKYERC